VANVVASINTIIIIFFSFSVCALIRVKLDEKWRKTNLGKKCSELSELARTFFAGAKLLGGANFFGGSTFVGGQKGGGNLGFLRAQTWERGPPLPYTSIRM
jgi:hypothetical protein